ncbi:putative sugar transferase EpsL [Pontiella desulfatans]|uniref:Putative sugar transferase EpsL n=1 Tax=Pontiella desulfatans TaxID=2750659 RepID=A0A6C2UB61_PONDE|nr:sugar transferase [Pontiella desulfatans]VGO16536.1 putative sugar transferase EpsL [Pontiella desulfatans]
MERPVYKARREMFARMDIPVTKADVQILKLKQRFRLVFWEGMLRSLLVFKRMIDIVASLVALVVLFPLFLMAALCILVEDGFPVIYTQKRVGLNGKEFRFHKFRSMVNGAEELKSELRKQNDLQDEINFKLKDDPRVLRCGRFMRRSSIDEIPQFFNVLVGDLSLVGPRPPLPEEVKAYSLADRKRLHVKPGLTCLWQIGGRSDLPFDQQVGLDMQYIQSQSIFKDIVIMLKTIPAVLFGRGAY